MESYVPLFQKEWKVNFADYIVVAVVAKHVHEIETVVNEAILKMLE